MKTNTAVQKQENPIELSIIQDIHEIRGVRVILDFDLARRYHVETGRLNEAVKRNIKRFPEDFMFQLTNQEFRNLKSQIAISSWGGTRKLPNAFTEQGVAMLSGLLNSDIAIDTNIKIMRAFVAIRQYVLNYAELKYELTDFMRETNVRLDKTNTRIDKTNTKLNENDVKVDEVFRMLKKLFEQKEAFENRRPIGFNADRIIEQNKKLKQQ
jgi:hypothetical protein